MTAFLRLWLPCAVLTWLILPGLTYLLDNRIDLTIEQFSRLVWVPAVQAGVLLAASTSQPGRTGRGNVIDSRPWRHAWARGVAGTSILLLGVAWLLRAHPALGTSAPRPLLVTWVGTLCFATGLLLVRATAGRRATRRDAARPTRVLSAACVLVGVECLTGGLGALFRSQVPLPTVLRWFALYGVGVMAVLAIVGQAADAWRRAGATVEARWLDAAGGLGFLVASAWVVNAFVRPYWLGAAGFAVLMTLTVASTMLVSAALSLAVDE